MTAQARSDRRARELARIHLGAKALGLEDEAYRDMLWAVARVRSARDLDSDGRRQVIEHLARCGAPVSRQAGRRPANAEADAMIGKVEALLADLRLSWSYAEAILRRQRGPARLEWAKPHHLRALIAALSIEQEKRHGAREVWAQLGALGLDEGWIEAQLPERWHAGKWRRDRRALAILIETLGSERARREATRERPF